MGIKELCCLSFRGLRKAARCIVSHLGLQIERETERRWMLQKTMAMADMGVRVVRSEGFGFIKLRKLEGEKGQRKRRTSHLTREV
jgi:hypothetical protein